MRQVIIVIMEASWTAQPKRNYETYKGEGLSITILDSFGNSAENLLHSLIYFLFSNNFKFQLKM